jgi:uncharacterized protein YbjT (DUF2867 family)
MRIAITAPTGQIGHKLVSILQAQGGHELVLLARKPERLADEQARGATVVQGNLEDATYVRRATQGVDALFWLIPPKLDAADFRAYQKRMAQNAAAAVRANGIAHVVLLSSIEQILRGSAPNLTILRPAYFMENFLMGLEGIAKTQTLFLPVSGDRRIPMVATRDIAAAAAKALVDPRARGVRIVPLHGPRDYSFNEVAQIIGDALGTKVGFTKISREQIREFLLAHGASKDVAELFPEMYLAIESGHMRPEHPRSAETTTPTTFEEIARTVLAPAMHAAAQRA